MKKIFIIISIFIISFASMSFKGCFMDEHSPLGQLIMGISGAQYDYGDNSAVIFYTISVGENGTILRTQGTNNLLFSSVPSGTTQRLNAVRTANNPYQDDAVIAGNNGTILYSLNAGSNWSMAPNLTSANLYGVDHSYFVYAVGDNGVIVSANYIGGTWSLRPSGTTRNLKAVTIATSSNQNVIVAGDKGTILRTSNGGFNWTNVSIPDTTFDFYDISQQGVYYSGDVFVAVGSGGRIYKSTNVGVTWQLKTSGTANTLRSVYFNSLDSGVAVGDNGTIILTTNGGESWFTNSSFNSPSTRHYKSVSLVYRGSKTFCAVSDTMFFVSEEPVIVGIGQANTEIPEGFSLSQNFPNPFNPETKIKFELPNSSHTKLVVYDIAGKEIETLVNEGLKAGVYEFAWNGITLPSGVYFYKLTADNFTETKKMILVK